MSLPSRVKNILHVIAHVQKGGAEKQLALLVANSCHNHTIATLHGSEGEKRGNEVIIPSIRSSKVFQTIATAIKEKNIDIIQLWLPERLTVPAMLAAKRAGCSIISGDRRRPRDRGMASIRDRLMYINHLAADVVIPNYPVIERDYSLRQVLGLAIKTRVIPNGVVLSGERRLIKRVPEKLLFVGRLVKQKQVSALILNYDRLANDFGIRELAIVGDGPERASLEQLAAQSGCRQVVFHGHQFDWGSKFDPSEYFLVLPSESEGMSNTLFEAIDHGFFPIVSDSPELRHLLLTEADSLVLMDRPDGAGVSTAVHQARALSVNQIAVRCLRLQEAIEEYSVARMASAYDSIYEKL